MRNRIVTFVLAALLVAATTGAQVWEVGNLLLTETDGLAPSSEFGSTLASGDFDGDGTADLVVRAAFNTGEVHLFLGGPDGPAAPPNGRLPAPAGWVGFGAQLLAANLDADGADELVVGIQGAPVEVAEVTQLAAGAIRVYDWTGAAWSLAATFTQETPGVPGAAEAYDLFGSALAAGDFDGDGHDDLAIGVLNEAIGAVAAAGAVNVLHNTGTGLGVDGAQVWYRSGGGISGTAAEGARLGWALAAGDFDGDGDDDLAIGLPGSFVDGQADSGEVVVLFGSIDRLLATGQQLLDVTDLGEAAAGQSFGSALAAAELDPTDDCSPAGECADDLVVGARYSTVSFGGPVPYAGRVWTVPGSSQGPDPAAAQSIDQGELAPLDWTAPESGDDFGAVLAIGRLDPDGVADLAVGTPSEKLGDHPDAGCVHLLFGGELSLLAEPPQYLFARAGLEGAPLGPLERFGHALAIGDFDGDGWGDLAVGLPRRDVDGTYNSGAVQILFGALFADGFERGNAGAWTTP